MSGLCCISSSSGWKIADASCGCEACHKKTHSAQQRLDRLRHIQESQEIQDLLHVLKEKTKNIVMVATDGRHHLIHIRT